MPSKITNWRLVVIVLFVVTLPVHLSAQRAAPIPQEDKTREISTEELQTILSNQSAIVLDARPSREYAMSHIPGAVNVAPMPGMPASMYVSDVAEIGRLLRGNTSAPVVLYCNGPHCGKTKRLAAELLDAGYRTFGATSWGFRCGAPPEVFVKSSSKAFVTSSPTTGRR